MKRALAVLVTLFLPRLLAAQYVGLSLGHVSSTVDWQYPAAGCDFCVSDESPNASRQSLAPAVAVAFRPTKMLGLSFEARYTNKGYAKTEPTLDVHYLEVPTLLRIGRISGTSNLVTPFGEIGPALALRLQCEVDYNGQSDPCRDNVAFGQDWRIRPIDVSAVAGLGAAIRSGDNLIIVGARLDNGLLDVGGGQGVPTKHRSSLLYVSWLWSIGRTAK